VSAEESVCIIYHTEALPAAIVLTPVLGEYEDTMPNEEPGDGYCHSTYSSKPPYFFHNQFPRTTHEDQESNDMHSDSINDHHLCSKYHQ